MACRDRRASARGTSCRVVLFMVNSSQRADGFSLTATSVHCFSHGDIERSSDRMETSALLLCPVDGWWSAFLRSGITLRFMPDLVRRSSSFLRSSSTRTSGRVWGRVGSLRRGCGEASQRQKSLRRAPAQRTIGGVGPAGVGAWWGFHPWWLSPVGSFSSPGTGGDQEPGGGATGDGFALLLDLTFACCTPARTLVGLRLPGAANDPPSAGELCAALGPGSGRGPALDVEFTIRSRSPVRSASRPCRSLLNFTSAPDPSRALN